MEVAIIGHFGGEECFTDGQTIKTITLYNALLCQSVKVTKVDTYYFKKKPILLGYQFLKMLTRDQIIIALLSSNGRRLLFPVLYIVSKFLRKRVFHYGIGGRLAREVKDNKNVKKYVQSFEGNWMESHLLVNKLKELGIRNAFYVPNFKNLKIISEMDLPKKAQKPYRFCTFSRVMEEKGITDAINAIGAVNQKYGIEIAQLDIYGPVESDYRDKMEKLLESSKACKYCGVVDAGKSVETVMQYYCLIFPSHWRHEGIPGTIIDALSAGVPVISRKWQYCSEMIDHGRTGLIYPFEEPEKLINTIEYAINHESEIMDMKTECLKKSNEYREEVVIKQIMSLMKII